MEIFTVIAVVTALMFVMCAYYSGHDRPASEGAAILGCLGVVLLLLAHALVGANYVEQQGKLSSMQAFYEDTLSAYEYTVTATGEVEITNTEAGLLDVAYLEQGQPVAERLKELRDKVERYNNKLRWFKTFNSRWYSDDFLPNAPDHLKPIHLE